MSATKHMGVDIPTIAEPFDPSDKRWVWFAWPTAVLSSEFILPAGWVKHAEQSGKNVIGDDGKRYKNCNGVLVSTSVHTGTYVFTNRVTIGTEQLDRSVKLVLRNN
jgi:hypothetical protein